MGRPKRADEAGGIAHALNRGPNARDGLFRKPQDDQAFDPPWPFPRLPNGSERAHGSLKDDE